MFAFAPATRPLPSSLRHLAPGLVRGLTVAAARPRLHTGLVALDEILAGGLPCGTVTEVVGGESSGKTTLAYAVIASVTSAGELAACIDLSNALDPEHAEAAGVQLSRLLWIRPPDTRAAFRAAECVLDAGGFRFMLLDLNAPCAVSSTVPAAIWLRLARAATRSGTTVMTLGLRCATGSFTALRLEVARRHACFSGHEGPSPLFEGLTSTIHVRNSKLGLGSEAPARLLATAAA